MIFTSDNGTNADLTSTFDGAPLQGGKGYTKDHGTHVPLIVNWPGRIPENQVNDRLIAFSDFFPTIVDAAGMPPKKISDGDGISFWPHCLGQEGAEREWIYGYYFPRPYSESFDDKYRHWEVRYARDKRYKLYGNGDLYDTQEDVLEKGLSIRNAQRRGQASPQVASSHLGFLPRAGKGSRLLASGW